MRVGGEIDAEEQHDQPGAEQTDNGQRHRGRPGGDSPGAEESAQHLHRIDILQEIGLIGESRELLGQRGGAGGDAAGEAGDLLGERWAGGDEHHGEEQGNQQHQCGEHQQPRQLGKLGQRSACAIQHDSQQDSGEGQQDRGARIPKADGESEYAQDPRRHVRRRRHVARTDCGTILRAAFGRLAQSGLGRHDTLARWSRAEESARVRRPPL